MTRNTRITAELRAVHGEHQADQDQLTRRVKDLRATQAGHLADRGARLTRTVDHRLLEMTTFLKKVPMVQKERLHDDITVK